ncbi:hypothetical protein C0991_004912 [Blastosporella zonata]|nr:hypothetical protein C0991_004912 [Blastosporella zonata]
MQFTSLFATVALSFVSVVSGAAILPRATLDVFVPTILTPNADTIWTMGTQVNVTWKTDNAPVNISNGAAVYIKGDLDHPLANGFDLRAGWVTVTVPFILSAMEDPTEKHQIILFGDSGDLSDNFTIQFDPTVFLSLATAKPN